MAKTLFQDIVSGHIVHVLFTVAGIIKLLIDKFSVNLLISQLCCTLFSNQIAMELQIISFQCATSIIVKYVSTMEKIKYVYHVHSVK